MDVTLSFRSGCHAQMIIALLLNNQRVTALQEVTLSFPTLSRRIPRFSSCYLRRRRRSGAENSTGSQSTAEWLLSTHTSRLHGVGWGETQGWGVPDCILQGPLELYSVKVPRRVLACSASTSRCLSPREYSANAEQGTALNQMKLSR